MAEGSTSSVSKGCFLFKRNNTISPRKRRYTNATDLIHHFEGESTENVSQRYDNYKIYWKQAISKVQELQANSKIFSQIVEYIQRAHTKSDKKLERGFINEIPTAVLLTGVNMPDHDIIFNQLAKDLYDVTPFIAVLHSKDCHTMKFMLKNLITQFMDCEEEEDEDDEMHSPTTSSRPRRLHSYTMAQLCSWYKERCQVSENPPLVVIFEDFEGFQPVVVQDFVAICSQYCQDIPITLVFGVATAVSAVHRALPHSVSTLLSIEKFQSQPSVTCLDEIISKVLMTAKLPFKLGAKVFRFLLENFLFHDFSLQNFSTGLQFCLMEHFYDNPASVLCCDAKEREDLVNDLSHEEVEIVRRRPSFRTFVESSDPTEIIDLLQNDDHTKTVILQLLDDLDDYHWYFFPVLECLHAMTANLPQHPLGRRVRDVYEYCLISTISDREVYKECIALLRIYSKDELVLLLQKCVNILTTTLQHEDSKEFCKDLTEPRDQLSTFIEQFFKDWRRTDLDESSASNQTKEITSKIVSRFELQEKLKTAVKQKRKESPFDQLRQEVVSYLDQLFRKYLRCPLNLPLHEVMYFNSVQSVKQHLIGMPRVAIQTALTDPHHYLECECCEIEPGAIQDTLPDVSIAYKLHLECGRLINLYDWLQAFSAVLDPEASNSKTSKKKKKSMAELQARFIQAVSVLQFLGFVKSTKRKTDHVQRLTWGGC
ncbi:hypothetical protein QZH41_012795 [Actinostola sp. cb2023]|nr:hypothetical protein QZH41_012795 [Actinostola sp. cb2023]